MLSIFFHIVILAINKFFDFILILRVKNAKQMDVDFCGRAKISDKKESSVELVFNA